MQSIYNVAVHSFSGLRLGAEFKDFHLAEVLIITDLRSVDKQLNIMEIV